MSIRFACGLALCLPTIILPLASAQDASSIYVSPRGNDSWSGILTEPDAANSDGPVATLARARDAVRAMRASATWTARPVKVLVRAGTYTLGAPLDLGAEDSGTAEAPIAYTAYPGEEVRLSGGRIVRGFGPVADAAVLQRLDDSARGSVIQADLKAAGIANFGPANANGAEVFFDNEPMTLARWPNEGFTKIVDLVVEDGHQIHGIKGSQTGKFTYEGDRPSRWVGEADPWLHGYWFWDWSDQRQPIESIDAATSQIAIKSPYHGYGYRKGQWYYAFNMLSELDALGEWYIDRERGVLYFWPPKVGEFETVVSVAPSLIVMKDVSHVTVEGLVLEASRGTAVTVSGGEHVTIEKCTIRNTGGGAAELTGKGHRVAACEIYRTGGGGISLTGGDRPSLTPGEMVAEDNRIHHYGRINRMYTPGIAVAGVGNRVAHNLIHDAPHMAVQFWGNEHLIEFNEIHHVCMESNDAGAIYAGRDWTMRGNQIRHNYLHHVTGFEEKGCVGVYLDDMFASAAIYGNVFYKVTRAAFIGGGRDCAVENNIFVDCKPALHVDARALNWAAYHADEWIVEAKEKGTLLGIAYNKPPYSERYPRLVPILDDNPKAPVGNVIARNICWGGTWDEVEEIARPLLIFEDNFIQQDPGFVDAAKEDFRLREDAPVYGLGFKRIPTESIGPRAE